MKKEVRTVVYDDELHIEAYRFEGIVQPFPNHFHEYYVIGFMEDGERVLSCKKQEYTITRGDVLLFNPGDNHACVQSDGGTLDYWGFNITKEVMLDLAEEAAGRREPVGRRIHRMPWCGAAERPAPAPAPANVHRASLDLKVFPEFLPGVRRPEDGESMLFMGDLMNWCIRSIFYESAFTLRQLKNPSSFRSAQLSASGGKNCRQ